MCDDTSGAERNEEVRDSAAKLGEFRQIGNVLAHLQNACRFAESMDADCLPFWIRKEDDRDAFFEE